ncbi:TraK family protein [Desulfovibrio sp. OttesenSCG-928-O18]|nr:TraK family protein [Desulfovibrio sp. OttesenSCG-928-O18]
MSSKPEVTPGKPGSARVEYFACREDVEVLIAKGYSAQMAYEVMKKQGRVTCSYSAFCDYVRGGGKRLHSRKGRRPKPVIQTAPARTFSQPRKNDFDISSVDVSKLF